MVPRGKIYSWLDIGVRIAADTIMVNAALALALLARYIVEIWWKACGKSELMLTDHLQ